MKTTIKISKPTMLYTAMATALAASMGTVQAADLKFAPGEDDKFNWESYDTYASEHDYSGQSLKMTGPWTGQDKELFDSVLQYFEEATGAEVSYTGSESFEQDVVVSAKSGTPPDIAVFPQPGLVSDMASQGYLTPLQDGIGDWVRENYAAGDSWVDLGMHANEDGEEHLYSFFYKADVKSLVWYSPNVFAELGYEIPETMEALKDLTDQIAADGVTPWCIGISSGAATGWPATDWVEDMMLRTQPPEVYDQWVSNEIPFTDPAVINAFEEYGYFAKNPEYVSGGPEAVVSTDFRDSTRGLFDFPPECVLHKQATFIPTFFPEGTELGTDVDFFYFPPYESEDLGKPVLGGGTTMGILNDSEVAHGFIEFLKTPIAHEIWMAQSGFLTPFKEVNPDAYANDTLRKQGDILTSATTFRFDASDLMPGEVGAGAFWKEIVAYTTGELSAEEATQAIQDRWDNIK